MSGCLDQFSIIVRASRNPDDKQHLHAMILSYFDDSADQRRERYFATGGLVASEEQWRSFYVPWAIETMNLKEPFRSAQCESQQGQFVGWSKEQCDQLMDKLVSVICDQQLHGFASVVPIREYREVFPDGKDYDAYFLSVKHTIINMAEMGRREAEVFLLGATDCWFEDSERTSGTTLNIYNQLRSVRSWETGARLAGIHFHDKTLHPLQAADLVAREAFKHFDNQGVRPTRIPVKRMGHLLNFIVWRREHLQYLRDHGGPDNLELLTSWGDPGRAKPPQFEVYWANYEQAR